MTRIFTLLLLSSASVWCPAQDAFQQGATYAKIIKGWEGDLQLVSNGTTDREGRPVLFLMEGNACKAVRLGAQLTPAEELPLHQQTFDGARWDAVTSLLLDDQLHVLFVNNTKKNATYAIGRLNTDGPLAIGGFQRITSFDRPNVFNAENTTCRKTLPDLILFDSGAAYDQGDRLVPSPDGAHFLLNHYTTGEKGNKRFWYACLDRSFKPEWSGVVELPYADVNSDIHQIALDDRGRIILLTYISCGDPERQGDKLCHETHLTVIGGQGTKVKDMLLDKDFVSSARILPKAGGKILVAMRYGALTGIPGQVLSIDTAMAKLKPTPLVDQRVAAIRKTRLTTFGLPDDGSGKKPAGSRAQKVPDEVIELMPAWNGGTLLLEGFRDQDMEVQAGDALAMRTLHGAIRATYLDAKDSIRWQQVVDRAFMTTSGEAYGSAAFKLQKDGLLLAYNNTPGGIPAINASYAEAGGRKKDAPPVEKSELKLAWIPAGGGAPVERTCGRPEGDFTLCPMTLVRSRSGDKAWIKSFDRGTQHRFHELDTRMPPR